MDLTGEILWFAMFFTPLIAVPLAWRYNTSNTKTMRVIIGLLLSGFISLVFLLISLSIVFRNGLGSA